MLIRRQSAGVKKSGRFGKIGGLLASVPSISRPKFRAACLRKIVWELFFRTGTLATQVKRLGRFYPANFVHRTSISEAIGDPPFYCLYGREPRLPLMLNIYQQLQMTSLLQFSIIERALWKW